MGGKSRVVFNLFFLVIRTFAFLVVFLFYLSQAMLAQAYVLPISSSALRVPAMLRDWARRERASSISSGGKAPGCRGIRLLRACSTGRLILFVQ